MTTLPKGSDFTNTLRHIDVVETPDQRFYDPVCVKYKNEIMDWTHVVNM
jgi:hypothetical protein